MSDANLPALPESKNFSVITAEDQFLKEVVQENIGGELDIFDLDRVKVPSGGGLQWKVSTLDGEEHVSHIDGIIIYFENIRAYWKQDYEDSEGNSPPDCAARGGTGAMEGQGDPGGSCDQCSLAKFGSADKGEGQACSAGRRVFILTENLLLPIMITCPPTSLKGARQFFMRLSSHGVPYFGVLSRLKLIGDKNSKGKEYSKIEFESIGRLSPEELERIRKYRDAITPALGNVAIDSTDYSEVEVSEEEKQANSERSQPQGTRE